MQRYECQDVQAVLSGLLDGELDAETSHLAEAHLAQCPPCRAVLQQAEETDDLLRATMGAYEVWPGDLEKRIRSEIFGEVDDAQSGQRRRRLILAAWSGWSIAAIVMLGFGLSLSQGWIGSSSGAGNSLVGSQQPSPQAPTGIRAWRPAVGSELVTGSIFDDDLGFAPTETARDMSPAEQPLESSATPPETTPVAEPALETAPGRSRFTDRALAGVEAEIEAAQWLQFLAASVPIRSTERRTPPPADNSVEPAPDSATLMASSEPPVNLGTGEVLHQASILLTVLEQAGEGSFSDVRMVQHALTSDDVLERLAVARDDLESPDSIDLVNRAWSMLEWTTGSVDQEELERVKQSIAMQDLPRRLERLSDQYWN